MRWIILLFIVVSTAQADMYRCEKGGKITYQDVQCPNARIINNPNGMAPSLEDQLSAKYRAASDRRKIAPVTTDTTTKKASKDSAEGIKHKKRQPRNGPSVFDPGTGETYVGAPGGIIDPRTSQLLPDVGGGNFFDPSTGKYIHAD